MTQRIFDIENEKDMADLWDILPIGIIRIKKNKNENTFWSELFYQDIPSGFIKINWHDKTEITRPIQEATEADLGKLCKFWSGKDYSIGILIEIGDNSDIDVYCMEDGMAHCDWTADSDKSETGEYKFEVSIKRLRSRKNETQ